MRTTSFTRGIGVGIGIGMLAIVSAAFAQPSALQFAGVQDAVPSQESPPKAAQDASPPNDQNPKPKPDDTKPLSERLQDGEGVLKPPRVGDPDIRKPTPAMPGNKMPVIVPPGEPGGDPSIQQK